MARLRNTPQQRLTFDLERRKSYAFRCVLLDSSRSPMNLGGCTLRFVVKRAEYDNDQYDATNLIVNSEATIFSPESGEASFSFQAAELDGPPGTYNYSIVLWTPDGFSATIMKGEFNLHANTESSSMQHTYTTGTSAAAVELTLRGNDVVNIVANSMTGAGFSNDIVGTGRPDDPSTLEARSLQLVNQAAVGTLFISLDGAGIDAWAWRKRAAGWAVVEGSYAPASHTHTIIDINSGAARNGRVLTADGAGGAVWAPPPPADGETMTAIHVGDGVYEIESSQAIIHVGDGVYEIGGPL